jgi:hypothetical protein
MRNLFYTIIGLVVIWYVMSSVMVYSAIWDSQARPTKNVEVHLKDGSVIHGSLSSDWDRQYVLETKDGLQYKFTEFNMMTMKELRFDDTFLSHWRATMPLYVLSMVLLAWWWSIAFKSTQIAFFSREKGIVIPGKNK